MRKIPLLGEKLSISDALRLLFAAMLVTVVVAMQKVTFLLRKLQKR